MYSGYMDNNVASAEYVEFLASLDEDTIIPDAIVELGEEAYKWGRNGNPYLFDRNFWYPSDVWEFLDTAHNKGYKAWERESSV